MCTYIGTNAVKQLKGLISRINSQNDRTSILAEKLLPNRSFKVIIVLWDEKSTEMTKHSFRNKYFDSTEFKKIMWP